jgi:hypothetical protein
MSVCAILLSYKRPQNIERIVMNLNATPSVSHIVLSNNNPAVDMTQWFDVKKYPIEFIQQTSAAVCAKRFEIALELPYDYFICPDDDLFLNAEQLESLLEYAKQDKSRVHGMFGQIKSYQQQEVGFFSGIQGLTCEVDILNRIYCFSREHLLRMAELAKLIDLNSVGDALHIDDLLLSFCGEGRPVCHDLGTFEDCPTSEEVGVATYTENGFDATRLTAYRRLADITNRH